MKMNVTFEINFDCEFDHDLMGISVSEEHTALIDKVMGSVICGKMNHSKMEIDDGDICLTAKIVV